MSEEERKEFLKPRWPVTLRDLCLSPIHASPVPGGERLFLSSLSSEGSNSLLRHYSLPSQVQPTGGRILYSFQMGSAVHGFSAFREDPTEVSVQWVFVDPLFRGKGFGRILGSDLVRVANGRTITGCVTDTSGKVLHVVKSFGATQLEGNVWELKGKK